MASVEIAFLETVIILVSRINLFPFQSSKCYELDGEHLSLLR